MIVRPQVSRALRLTDEEEEFVDAAGIGSGMLVSGRRRVTHELFEKLSADEYAAFHTDPVIVPIEAARKERVS